MCHPQLNLCIIGFDGAELHRQYGHLGFDELDAPVVTTDEYGLSDRDGYEMG